MAESVVSNLSQGFTLENVNIEKNRLNYICTSVEPRIIIFSLYWQQFPFRQTVYTFDRLFNFYPKKWGLPLKGLALTYFSSLQ